MAKTVKSKVVKKKAVKKSSVKTKGSLSKKDEKKELLATIKDAEGNDVNIERWHIKGFSFLPTPIIDRDELSKETKPYHIKKFMAIRIALQSKSKDLQDEAIDELLGDLVVGAYQDKLIAYRRVLTENYEGSSKAFYGLQKIRQTADMHLLKIIKAIRDIKRPPVNVVVKEAEQVNVAEQINQGDKQVNIAKNQHSNNTPNP